MINWTQEFETGSAELDQQHRLLIDNINLLEDLITSPSPGQLQIECAMRLVDYLEAYANVHFGSEEQCMEAHRCPVHLYNRQEHQRFRDFIRDYKRLCEIEGFKLELLQNLHRVMDKWITDHILKVDVRLRPCLQDKQLAV